MVKPGLVDHLGRPIETKVLREEISGATITGVRSILSSHPEIGLDPVRLAAILQAAETGDAVRYLELAEAMEEKDLHYHGVMGTRKRAVSQLPITIEAGGEDSRSEEIATFVRDWLKRDTVEDELFDVLDAIGKGFSVTEIIWETSARQWWPARLKHRPPTWFQFDRVTGEQLRMRDESPDGAELAPFKFLVHLHKAKSGLPIRGGLARVAAWGYLFKNFTLKDWVAFCERYGVPFRLGRYDQGATAGDRAALLRALAMIGTDAAGIVPDTTKIEFVEAGGATGNHSLFAGLADYIDKQVSKAVLGQTATTDATAGGLGGSQGTVHNDVRGDIERADAKLLAATLNQQLIRPLVDLNYGPQTVYPRAVIGREEAVDLQATVSAVTSLVPLGVRISESWARSLVRAPEPKDGEQLLTAPRQPAALAPTEEAAAEPEKARKGADPVDPEDDEDQGDPKAAGKGQEGQETTRHVTVGAAPRPGLLLAALSALSAPAAAPADPIDRLSAVALADWAPMIEPALAPLEQRLAACSSLEEAREVLLEALADVRVEELADNLARASFASRVAGLVGMSTVPEDEA